MKDSGFFTVLFAVLVVGGLYILAARVDGAELVKFTCYCPESCPGTVTASGTKVREGIIASSRDHLGDCAMVYLTDGTFLGYYEALDIGGTDGIRNGYVIDVWAPSLAKARELMALTEGEVYIEWIERPQG